MDQAQLLGIAIGLGVFAALLLVAFVKANIVICQPNEIVVISGRRRRQAEGPSRGYRVLRGGRGFRWPLLESVARLPLTTLPLELALHKVLCAGMIPVSVEGRANVKLAGTEEAGLDAAIERFLGKGPDAVTATAKQAIEGALRGVIVTLAPEDANAQRLDLARGVAETARAELSRLGIVLDLIQIESIGDDQGYLEAIGRRRNAQVRRDARIAEAEADAEARRVAAEQTRRSREAEIAAERAILQEESQLAVERAELRAGIARAEQKIEVAGTIARTDEEIDLESRRIELSRRRHQADTVVPAEARRDAMVMEAEGKASFVAAEGRATAEALELLRAQWGEGETRDLFLIRMLPELLDKVTRVVADNLRVDKLTVVGGGDGSGLASWVQSLGRSAVVLLEELENATGVDVAGLAKRRTGGVELPPERS